MEYSVVLKQTCMLSYKNELNPFGLGR